MRIKEVIKSHGLTINEVADRMGISRVGLSQHINGNPSVEVLERIAKAVGCNVGEFFIESSHFTAFISHKGELKRFDAIEPLRAYLSTIQE